MDDAEIGTIWRNSMTEMVEE